MWSSVRVYAYTHVPACTWAACVYRLCVCVYVGTRVDMYVHVSVLVHVHTMHAQVRVSTCLPMHIYMSAYLKATASAADLFND